MGVIVLIITVVLGYYWNNFLDNNRSLSYDKYWLYRLLGWGVLAGIYWLIIEAIY